MAAVGTIEIRGFSLKKAFSLQIHSFASVAMVNVERREGLKSCDDLSGQTDRWNRDRLHECDDDSTHML